jgi:hypothetical protein
VDRHIRIVAMTEKSRIMRERLFYGENPKEYARCLLEAKAVDSSTADNLIRMTSHIIQGAQREKIIEQIKTLHIGAQYDTEMTGEGVSDVRISESRANQLLTVWKRIQVQHEV